MSRILLTRLLLDLEERIRVCREARAVERRTFNCRGRLDTLKWQAVWLISIIRRYGRKK